jgi:hypothetical protein
VRVVLLLTRNLDLSAVVEYVDQRLDQRGEGRGSRNRCERAFGLG